MIVSYLRLLYSGLRCTIAVALGQAVYSLSSAQAAESQPTELKRNIAYGKLPKQKLDLVLPSSATIKKTAPILVFFHGGGWSAGSKDSYRQFAQLIAQKGYIVVLPNYRLYPVVRFPEFVNDSALAVKWVQDQVSEYGGDPSRLVISGHSAGAHISALLAFDDHFLKEAGVSMNKIRGWIGISGPYAMPPSETPAIADVFGAYADQPASMPINFVDGSEPATLLIHGGRDWLVPTEQSRLMEEKLTAAGSQVELAIFERYKHIDILPGFRLLHQKDAVLDKILEFLEARTTF